jgi:transglutaminase-like putative cysteine protease
MKTSPFCCSVRFLSAALLVFACQPGLANWLGKDKQDLPQWGLDAAKTPTPAYVKDAAAVVLFDEYLETVDAQGRATEREREAIRILKPQGRSDAMCGVSYDVDEKINYFREWTIAADQKQYQAQDTDFIDVGDTSVPIMLSTRKSRVVHPPAADVGATIVCESEELLEPYLQETFWQIQTHIPVVFQALEVDLPVGRSYSAAWHKFPPVKPVEVAPNHWRWELKDMPELDLRDVKSRPDWVALAARMSVLWGDAAVQGTDNQWRAIGQWQGNLEENRHDPSPEITAKAIELTASAPDFYTKLTRITDYIQKNVRYFVVERGVGGWQPHYASDIFRNRYGDCKDKTTLLISMLQTIGIHASSLSVDVRRGFVDPAAPSRFGDHMITAIEVPADVQDPRLKAIAKAKDGKRYLIFDPTNERTPVGNLPSYEQGSFGYLAAGASSQIIALPVLDPDANGTEQKGAFTLAADGTLTGSVDTSHIGSEGALFRRFLKKTDTKEQREDWEKYVAYTLPGVTLDAFQFIEPSALDKPLEFHYKVTARQYSHQAGSLLLVRPRVVGSVALPFDDKSRIYPIDLDATGRWRDSFDIAIPPGYVVDEAPDPVAIDLDFASYHSSVSAKGNLLHYEREYVVRKVEIPPAQAADFRRLESAILADEKNAAVLKKQ